MHFHFSRSERRYRIRTKLTMKTIIAGLFLSLASFAQVYSAAVGSGGSGFTTATITATGGGCTSQPTFSGTVTSNALSAVTVKYAGFGCTSAPTLTVTGGTGATATASLLPASIVLLSSVPSLSGGSLQPSVGGTYMAWVFACELVVPSARVPFYAAKAYTLLGTSQISQFSGIPNGYAGALAAGLFSEYVDQVILTNASSTATIEAAIQSSCTTQQTAINAWNPWAFYGTTFFNGVWSIVSVP